uniref:Uncharacterized protein n=1 Tax=Anguilla anguilla TaxID=7936 RepID=A0A0E9PES7_ANGAN
MRSNKRRRENGLTHSEELTRQTVCKTLTIHVTAHR